MNNEIFQVEAMEPEYRQLSSNRPDSIAVFGAVCPTAGKMEFLISSIGGWHVSRVVQIS